MKRSEIKNIIYKELMINEDKSDLWLSAHILAVLEEKGMLPPCKIKRTTHEDEFTYENHEWENE